MEKQGLIILDHNTGRTVTHWSGAPTKAFYIEDRAAGVPSVFPFRGKTYEVKYFDGCFNPFVVTEGTNASFV